MVVISDIEEGAIDI